MAPAALRPSLPASLRRGMIVLAAGCVGIACTAPSFAADGCAKEYSYAGLVSDAKAHGVRTTLTAVEAPEVDWGHVAAWVGVGGRGQGRNGSDAWIQVGYSGFYGGEHKLYYEVARPGAPPRYTALGDLRKGEVHRVGVLEMRGRRGWWRVWVDGRPASPPINLPGSHGLWHPIATAESWNGGMGACNRLAYRFEQTSVALRAGGRWAAFRAGQTFQDPGYHVIRRTRVFDSRSRA